MKLLIAAAIGYVFGAKTKGRDLDQLGVAVKRLYETDEFADVVSAARSHLGSTLREVANILDGRRDQPDDAGSDLVAQVRHLVGGE